MDDDFNDDFAPDTGRAFGRGKPINYDDDSWGNNENGDSNEWNAPISRAPRGGGRGGQRDRGGRGGGRGGSRGGHYNKSNDQNGGNGWGNSRDDNDEDDNSWGKSAGDSGEDRRTRGGFSGGSSRGGRGRGGGRGAGGRGGGASGDSWNGDNKNSETEKPKERYIPPDPTENEEEIFGSGNTTGINFDKYDDIGVKVSGENITPPIKNFNESGLRKYLLENIAKSNYTKPTPIQKHAIPIIMNGRDVMACAQTGSGKTAAFLLPILHALLNDPQDLNVDSAHCEPQAVIVLPTRELAIQIHDECRKFSHGSIIRTVVAYGGAAVFYQINHLLKGCHILVATPGRLKQFVEMGKVTFNSVRFVVLDEADRMLDMGFLPDIEKFMNHETMVQTGDRQTLMFSATFPEEIQKLAGKFLSNYVFITVGIVGGACSDVTQTFYQVDKFSKQSKLLEIFQEHGTKRTVVFVETKRNTDYLASFLCENDFKATSIHGDRLQREREEALADFKSGRRDIIVATGVLARGLDIKNVLHVINYDLPDDIDEYVHRIGRTGRVGNSGKATSFFDGSKDARIAKGLIKILEQCNQPVPDYLKKCENAGDYGGFRSSKFGGRDVRGDDFGTTDPAPPCEEEEEW